MKEFIVCSLFFLLCSCSPLALFVLHGAWSMEHGGQYTFPMGVSAYDRLPQESKNLKN